MKTWVGFIVVGLLAFVVFESHLKAEPWVSNRYAQNCASCHAPGRFNQPVMDRRCTLSCQGCHVNPSGGGMRNFYGKWNSQRFLTTWQSKDWTHKSKPLPWFAQGYVTEKEAQLASKEIKKGDESLYSKAMPSDIEKRKALVNWINKTKAFRKKSGDKTLAYNDTKSDFEFNEWFYERANGDIAWYTEMEKLGYEKHIPKDDPYYQTRQERVHAGMDFRYMYESELDNSTTDETESYLWPMALDVGVQLKPFIGMGNWRRFSIVSETRYMNGPTTPDLEYLPTNSIRAKSLYMMFDDLPFNSYVQHGIYKPMFEHYTPDHTSLAQTILWNGQGYQTAFRTTSFGAAPNVPFANIHIIQASQNPVYPQEDGYALNLGGRWVVLGLSTSFNLWNTENKDSDVKTSMSSWQGGISFFDFILNVELLNISRESPGTINEGGITTVELRYPIYKSIYAEGVFETANTSATFTEGSSQQYTFGLKGFIIPGMELSAHYQSYENLETGFDNVEIDTIMLQAHLFY